MWFLLHTRETRARLDKKTLAQARGMNGPLITIMSNLLESWETHERRNEHYSDRFMKRSLRPREYKLNYRGEKHVPFGSQERLKNEASSLQFIKTKTNISVPRVLEAYEEDGSFHLWTELVPGITMAELGLSD